jgi:Leucine Rich repeat
MESVDSPVQVTVTAEPARRKRPQWRLRILLGFGVLSIALFAISRLEPDQAKRYGPFIESVYRIFNPPIAVELSEAGRQFIAEVAALGGHAGRIEPERKFLGLFAPDEAFAVSFSGKFDDAALARLATNYGDRIASLYLMDTSVTDDGLRHLQRFGKLRHLILASMSPVRAKGKRLTQITDAGMAYLDSPNLVSLNLHGLPITDAGLQLLPDLPFLNTLQLTGTKVEGPGLSRLVAFRNLASLHLNGCPVTDEGLSHLAGAPSLMVLGLDGIPLTAAGLKLIIKLKSLRYLSIRGCQIPSGDVEEMRASAPLLRIER